MKIIAFDLGSNMAFAHNLNRKVFASSKVFKGIRSARLALTLVWLEQLDWSKFNATIYETPFARGRDATRSLWGIAGLIEACSMNAGVPVVDAAVPTIKKFATGSGKGSKDQMTAAAKEFGYKGNNEHEADAVCLLKYAEENLERAA